MTEVITNRDKEKSDYAIYRKFWPEPIAKILLKKYSKSEESNKLKE